LSRFHGETVQIGQAFQVASHSQTLHEAERKLEAQRQAVLRQAEAEAQQITQKARQEAAQVLQAAKAKAEALVSDASAQEESIRQEAYNQGNQAGYDAGYQDGLEQARSETLNMLESAQRILDTAYQAEQTVLTEFKPNAARLISHLTQKILKQALVDDPTLLFPMLEAAIDSLHVSGNVRAVVSETLLEHLRTLPECGDALSRLTRLTLVSDPQLEVDQVFLVSHDGHFDLGLGSQLTQLMTMLKHKLPVEAPVPAQEDPEPEEDAQAPETDA
jgi:flagellar assembly protein FliH